MLRIRLVWACALGLACALPGAPAPGPWREWQSAHDRDHPMAGRVIEVAERREISPDDLLQLLRRARLVLLGEQHDNPDHHRLQAWLIEGLARSGQRRGVAFEMLPLDAAEPLDAALALRPGDVDAIPQAVGWQQLGWPEWPIYRPVFQAALAAGFPIRPADLSRAVLAQLRAGAPPPESLVRLGLAEPLPDDGLEELRADLERAHCGMLPPGAVGKLVEIQRARDAQLAASLAAAAGPDGAVLIAGGGHAARAGVPFYLPRAAPGGSVAALGLLEVDPGERDLEAALGRARGFDYVWLTPRVDDTDPCERFREQLKRFHPDRNPPVQPDSAVESRFP